MVQITKAEALRIQAEQTEFYAARYGEDVRRLVAEATTADQLEDGVLYDIVTINRHIPRGGWFESNIPAIRDREEAIKEQHRRRLEAERQETRKGAY